MPDVKLEPITTRQQLRKTPSVTKAAHALNVHPSTITRFIQREGIDLNIIATAQAGSMERTAQSLKELGMSHSHIARRLAVSPGYITQLLTKTEPTHA